MTDELRMQWQQCCRFILDNVGETRFNTWFAKTSAVRLESDSITLQVPSNYFVELYETNYLNLLHAALKKVFGRPLQIFYEVQILADHVDSKVTLGESRGSAVISSKLERSGAAPVSAAAQTPGGAKFNSQLKKTIISRITAPGSQICLLSRSPRILRASHAITTSTHSSSMVM